MAITKKQQVRGVRILLTVFYGFLLSSILFRYLVHGVVQTLQKPTNPYAISLLVIGGLVLISIGLAIYATWFDNTIIMLVSGVVLILVFIITLVFGILRITKTAHNRGKSSAVVASNSVDADLYGSKVIEAGANVDSSDSYALAEDVAGLIIELVAILFAILGTFVLFRYVKAKYAAVPTTEPKPA